MSPLTHQISKSTWYLLAAIYASMFAMVIGLAIYTNHVAHQSERKWCATVITLDDSYRQTPPTTPVGQNIARSIRELRESFRCPPSD